VSQPPAPAAELDLALARVNENVRRAGEAWNVGERLPEMSRWRGALRGLALPAARLFLRMAQLVTRDQREFNDATVGALRELAAAARALQSAAERDRVSAERLARRLGEVEAAARAHVDAASAALRADLDRRSGEMKASLDRLAAVVAQRDHQLAEVLEAAARERAGGGGGGGAGATVQAAANAMADRLYADFEDRFRGTPALIKERAGAYLPIFRAAGAGAPDRPVLDLGCGRGELLEVLRENGMAARGADTSTAFVKRCKEQGLEVEHADALSVLRRLSEAALGAVTAIHVIEHLSLPDLAALVGECARVLRPGGVALFETPNPKNLSVGACTFYMDPTHVRPLPPEFMTHLMERAGFQDVKVLYARPDPRFRTEPISDPTLSAANEMLLGPQDYAVVGTRP